LHNERLEFLGDSILNCVVASLLFDSLPISMREIYLVCARISLSSSHSLKLHRK